MSDALIIRFAHDDADVQYLLVDATGGRLGAVLSGSLTQAAPLAANRRVVVLIPGAETLAAEPELPAKNATRLAQLAPYALEEQLATDIDSMHFAIGKRMSNGKTPVEAVLRNRIEAWLEKLDESGIRPDAMYSESSVIPSSSSVTLIVDHGRIYFRPPESPGLTLDVQPLESGLDLAFGETADDNGERHVLRDLQLYATQADYETQQSVFDGLSERIPGIQIKLLPEGPLPLFALQAVTAGSVDFLSGPYKRKSSLAMSFAPWRYAAVLLGIAALLYLGDGGIRLWQSSRTERALDKQINELVAQTLPGVTLKDTRDARKQFESRLSALKRGGGDNELLIGLSVLSQALAQSPESRIEAMHYRAQTIDLRVTAPNVGALDKIQQAATAAGMATAIQSANERDNKIEGRLQLKPGA